jgi:hypothetical protein
MVGVSVIQSAGQTDVTLAERSVLPMVARWAELWVCTWVVLLVLLTVA